MELNLGVSHAMEVLDRLERAVFQPQAPLLWRVLVSELKKDDKDFKRFNEARSKIGDVAQEYDAGEIAFCALYINLLAVVLGMPEPLQLVIFGQSFTLDDELLKEAREALGIEEGEK